MSSNSPHPDAPFEEECYFHELEQSIDGMSVDDWNRQQKEAALLDIKYQLNRMEQDIKKLDERTWTDKDQAIAQMRDYIKRCSYILFAVAYSETESLNEKHIKISNELKNEYREKFA